MVEKVREELQVTPWDLVFSGVRGAGEKTETVSARNMAAGPVEIRAITLAGEQASTFRLNDIPALPTKLPPKASLSVTVSFAPTAGATLGVHRALLRFQTGPAPEDGPAMDIAALVTRGLQGDHEPPLQQVVEALGFEVNVGGTALRLGTAAAPIGDEIVAPLFRRAKPAPVALNPVARYSAAEPLPFGIFKVAKEPPALEQLAVIAAEQAQTLNPDLDPGGRTSFDPGEASFGVWVKSGKHVTYTESRRNTGPIQHAARVYPLRTRGGALVQNAYLVVFEEASDGDYQDCVFVLWNVTPAGG
jgi:hypothetical protein